MAMLLLLQVTDLHFFTQSGQQYVAFQAWYNVAKAKVL
jgi:hypothetical protein